MRARDLLPALAAVALLSLGCGDGSGPGEAMTADEEASLIDALRSAGVIAAAGPLTFGAVLAQADELGSAGGHAAVAYQMHLVFTGDLAAEAVSSGLLGWSGLNTGANTVASALNTGVLFPVSGFPETLDEPIGNGAPGTGLHYIRTTSAIYLADAGSFTMTAATFGAMSDCAEIPDAIAGFAIESCRAATGTMAGSFEFEATRITGTGATAFSQPPTSYGLPAVRLELVIDVAGIAELRAALGLPAATAVEQEVE